MQGETGGTTTHKSFSICSSEHLGGNSLDMLVAMFSSAREESTGILEGRAAPKFAVLPELGPVAIKFYRRGGLLAHINRSTYLRTGPSRAEREFEFLANAKNAGVRVPGPLAHVTRGGLFYQAWLITERICDHVSFARLCREETERALSLMPAISTAIGLLIENGIHHVDLHPGNILIDRDNREYIIDFDKAHYFSGGKTRLAALYRRRWKKAVSKYNLPPALTALELD
ncbi:MAG: phosphotransferase [Desulfobacteraceae bacterium]|nr:phosphotransferase [Desulfobacteraceae bacterium]